MGNIIQIRKGRANLLRLRCEESSTRGGKTYYYHTNYRGDVVALTDSAGAVVATYEYDAYGNLLKETGNVENPYRYAGYRYDKESGLYYLQSRYYNPETGRFLTRDAIEGDEDNPLSFNKYAYAENNPTGKIDPDGNRAFWFGSISRSGSSVRIYIKKWIVTTWQNLSIGFYHFATYVIAILASPSVVVGGLIAVVGNLFIRAFDQITSSRIGRKGTRIIIRGKYYSNRVNKLIRKRIYKRTRWGVKRYSVRVRIRKTVRTWYPTGFSVTKWN